MNEGSVVLCFILCSQLNKVEHTNKKVKSPPFGELKLRSEMMESEIHSFFFISSPTRRPRNKWCRWFLGPAHHPENVKEGGFQIKAKKGRAWGGTNESEEFNNIYCLYIFHFISSYPDKVYTTQDWFLADWFTDIMRRSQSIYMWLLLLLLHHSLIFEAVPVAVMAVTAAETSGGYIFASLQNGSSVVTTFPVESSTKARGMFEIP